MRSNKEGTFCIDAQRSARLNLFYTHLYVLLAMENYVISIFSPFTPKTESVAIAHLYAGYQNYLQSSPLISQLARTLNEILQIWHSDYLRWRVSL